MRISSFVLIGCVVVVGCKEGKAPPVEAPLSVDSGKPVAAVTSAPASKSKVALAKAPAFDLLDNQYMMHVYRDGLVIPFASEGFRKYVQEYAQPWGEVFEASEQTGRVLTKRSAILYFPWRDDKAGTLRLWIMGAAAGQRVEVRVNGSAQTKSVPEGWSLVEVPLAAGVLQDGENRLGFLVSKSGLAGGKKAYGVFGAVEIVSADAVPNPSPPPLVETQVIQVGGTRQDGLMSPGRLEMWVEIPQRAYLDVQLGALKANTPFAIRARTKTGNTPLVDFTAPSAGWFPQQVSLEGLAGQLVSLEFIAPIGASWGEPRIALEEAPARARPKTYQNAVLVVVDAMRADKLTLYNPNTRVRTPRMTELAKERGVVFLKNQGASPSSPPSHGSIQTGMIPRVHGVVGDKSQVLPGTPTISGQLADAGLATGYYGNNSFGMGRHKTAGKWTEFHQPSMEGKGSDCNTLMRLMLDFAKQQHAAGKRFFISSLPYEPHTPYLYWPGITDHYYSGTNWAPPVGKHVDVELDQINRKVLVLNDDEWARMKALYDGEVEKMDQCFGELMDGLKQMGVLDDTLVVLTSDHGEGMFEHEQMGHAWGHNAELANVPLVLYGAGLEAGRAVDVVSNHINILPTILDLLGVKVSEKVQGQSLVPLLERSSGWTPRVVSLEYGRSYSLRAHDWRYISDPGGTETLFDVAADPGEKNDLLKSNGFGLRYMRDMVGFFLAHRSEWHEATWGTLNNHGPGLAQALSSH